LKVERDGRLNFAGAGKPPLSRADSLEIGDLILRRGAHGRQHHRLGGGSFQLWRVFIAPLVGRRRDADL